MFLTLLRTSSDLSDSTLLSRPTSLPLPDPSLPEESDTFPVPPTKRDDGKETYHWGQLLRRLRFV